MCKELGIWFLTWSNGTSERIFAVDEESAINKAGRGYPRTIAKVDIGGCKHQIYEVLSDLRGNISALTALLGR